MRVENGPIRGDFMVSYKSALKRISGGKTVKVEMEIRKGRIVKFMLSGDFFAYPPEQLEKLEKEFIGRKADVETVAEILEGFRDKIELTGISMDDIADLVNKLVMADTLHD